MSEFDKWFKNRHTKSGLYEEALCGKDDATYIRHEMRKAYLAGQQSQKAKVDELQRKIAFQEKAIKNIKLQFKNKQIDCDRSDRKIDELQARVDDALKILESDAIGFTGLVQNYDRVESILKGNKDEN